MNRRILVALVGVLVLAGCSDRSTWTENERLAEPLTFENALAADQNLEDEYWATMRDELGIVLSDETRTDRYGSWHPLTLAPDAPVLDIDPGIVPEDLDPTWTMQDLQNAWQAMAEFLVNEQLDSEVVWDDTPENRSLLADRAGLDVLWKQDPLGVDYFLNSDSRAEAWMGLRYFDQDNGEWRETGGQVVVEYLPAQPAPYRPDRPRTLIGSLVLSRVTQGEEPETIDMAASVRYCRSIYVESIEGRRYECRNLTHVLTLAQEAGELDVVGMSTEASMHDQVQAATISDETRLRLPILKPTSADEDWLRQEVGGLVLSLPRSTVPDPDGSCKGRYPEGDPGTTFILGKGASDYTRCLRVLCWPVAADGPVVTAVGTNQTIWYAQRPGLRGTVVISAYFDYYTEPASDVVDFLLTDGPSAGYRVTAEVPAGTGEEFARQLLATFDASAGLASSPP